MLISLVLIILTPFCLMHSHKVERTMDWERKISGFLPKVYASYNITSGL